MNKLSLFFAYAIIIFIFSAVISAGIYLSIVLLPIIIFVVLILAGVSWFVNRTTKKVKVVYKNTSNSKKSDSDIIDAEYEIIDKE